MLPARPTILLIGYGNPARGDDGLGPAFAEAVERLRLDSITVETGYQLQIEDAIAVTAHDAVIFVDADASCPPPFELRRIEPARDIGYTSHAVAPPALLAAARQHLGARTEGYVLGIRGTAFGDFQETLSDEATAHLEAAIDFLVPLLRDGALDAAASPAGAAPAATGTYKGEPT